MKTRTLARWIELVSWALAAFGILLPFAYTTSLFAPYRDALAQYAYGTAQVSAADERLLGLMLGIAGGSIAGKWTVHAMLARGPLAEGQAWARDLTLLGLALWFTVDSLASVLVGATFNVWMINVLPLLLVGVPLAAAGSRFQAHPSADVRRSNLARACVWASFFGAGTGLGIAFGGTTPLFSMWFGALESAHYGGAPLTEDARRLALAFFGPIGGCTVAQFGMLAGMAVRKPGAPWTAVAGVTSLLVWFVVDSAWGFANDGLFNIAMVNVPAILVTLPPWLLLLKKTGV